MEKVKTLEENRKFVEDLARLSLFFAKKYMPLRKPEKSIREHLLDHTPLFHHALMLSNYQEKWACKETEEILLKAEALSSLSPEDFEEEMWDFMKEFAIGKADEKYERCTGVNPPLSWNCGSLKYDPPKPDLPEGTIIFHINNAVGPKSIFDDPDYLKYCFLLLLKETEMKYGAKILRTATWLNGRSEFLRFFPEEWMRNMRDSGEDIPSWHYGFWGQVITGKGMINPKMDAFIRNCGYLKYRCYSSSCSYENMYNHLKGL